MMETTLAGLSQQPKKRLLTARMMETISDVLESRGIWLKGEPIVDSSAVTAAPTGLPASTSSRASPPSPIVRAKITALRTQLVSKL